MESNGIERPVASGGTDHGPAAVVEAVRPLPWVRLAAGRRYFETEDGDPFLIIGQNDALTWPELEGLLGRRDLPSAGRYLRWLRAHGVTTMRLMLEYVGDGLYLEPHAAGGRPDGEPGLADGEDTGLTG